jgi:ATP-dependent phosphoenolpyruvate carboxykinase
MEVFVRGSRSSAQDWVRAQEIPLSELPPLDEQQKAAALRENVSEENYARSAYAGHLSQQKLLQRTLHFGRWLNSKVQERNPECQVNSVTLDTWEGKYQVTATANGEPVEFEIDEDLVERFLSTGSAEMEKAIFRLLDVYLPHKQVARAS